MMGFDKNRLKHVGQKQKRKTPTAKAQREMKGKAIFMFLAKKTQVRRKPCNAALISLLHV
jgi:hypothetical protein